jgi:transcriptional regulator with XRE-family HTH domain
MANTLGGRIAEYRKGMNITQDQLAEKMGVSSQAVSKWENDLSCPDISLLPGLADFYGVTVDALLRGDKEGAVRMLPEEQRKDFNKMLLKIKVVSSNGDLVNINLPIPLIKACIDMGMSMPQMSGNESLKNIDFGALLMLAESGAVGKLIEVHSAEGDDVDIVIE